MRNLARALATAALGSILLWGAMPATARASDLEPAAGQAQAGADEAETAQGAAEAQPEEGPSEGTDVITEGDVTDAGPLPDGEQAASDDEAVAQAPKRAPSGTGATRSDAGRAYAVYDDFHRTLTLVRSYEELADGPGQTVTDICGNAWEGTVWGGFEDLQPASKEDVPWFDEDYSLHVSRVSVADGCLIRPASCAWWFYPLHFSLTSCSLEGLDTSRSISFAHMFGGCSCLKEVDLSPLDTSSATDMTGMFSGCVDLVELDCSGFDTSRVTKMGDHAGREGMFSNCWDLERLDISGFDTSNVTDLSGLFGGCYALEPIPVADIDTSSATDMQFMFSACYAVTRLDLSHFDTSRCENMTSMFAGCSALEYLDISSFDTGSVTAIKNAFNNCKKVSTLVLGERFSFVATGGDGSERAKPPVPPWDDTYDGDWVREDDEMITLDVDHMPEEYDGATMAGTFVWERWHDCPLTLDLAGGKLDESVTYPTSYSIGHITPLPGTSDSDLPEPTRYGYSFICWLDENGRYTEEVGPLSRGPRTLTAEWYANQIYMSVPVAATLAATQAADGTVDLTFPDGDYSLQVRSYSAVPVTVRARATAAEGFRICADPSADLEADVWMTPVSTGGDPKAEGYDPTTDEGYAEHGQIRLSQILDQTVVGPTLPAYSGFWLNKIGGKMGGWSTNEQAKAHLASITWTMSLAPEE